MLTPKLKARKEATHPEGAGAPKGSKLRSPFHQIDVPFRIGDDAKNTNHTTNHETVAPNCVPEADIPTNITKIRLPPRTRRFGHGAMPNEDEANARNDLHVLI